MAFQVNTNINAMNAHVQSALTQNALKTSLERLSSGLRINKAADDASGMTVADSLRSQASSLGQAIANTNDGMGIIQVADKAMDEQLKILDTVKVKATQAAQDGQTTESRKAIQSDIVRLIQGLDNIGNTTTYNGQALLSGQFTNKEFQVGAYSNQSIKASIGSTTSDKIGQVRIATGALITASGDISLTFKQVDGVNDVTLESVKVSSSAGTGIGVLAEVINKNSNRTGVKAWHWPSFYNVVTGKTLALPNLIALQHIPLSPAGVIAKRPAPIALPNSLRSLNGEWRLMRYFLLTHLCGISHRIWCTLSTICSDAA
ncbi:Putative flagellin [Escherichia coli]|nr:Putative flagellin [Escherichia coli]